MQLIGRGRPAIEFTAAENTSFYAARSSRRAPYVRSIAVMNNNTKRVGAEMNKEMLSDLANLKETAEETYAVMMGTAQIIDSIGSGKLQMNEFLAETLKNTLVCMAQKLCERSDCAEVAMRPALRSVA